MKKRKIVLCATALLLSLTLASCDNNTTSSLTTTESNTTTTTTTNPTTTITTSEIKVEATGVIFSVEDENGEGTLENPYTITVSQGFTTSVPYVVQPNDATIKELKWEVGKITDGKFTTVTDTGVTVTKTTSPAEISVSETASGVATVKASTQDGSNIETYININIEEYKPVTDITAEGLLEDETEEYDYIFKTALGTTWDMSGEELNRKTVILSGGLDNVKGKQIPRNLTYWPNLYSMNINVAPEDASDRSFTVESSNEDVFTLKTDGTYEVTGAGEAVVTIKSYVQPEVEAKIKVEVADTLYPGILKDVYESTETSLRSAWNLDPADEIKGTAEHDALYDDWHLVMMQTNERRGSTGDDGNQKIYYMGQTEKPYGIDIENRVNSNNGGDTTKASGLIWAKVNVPQNAKTFNVKIGSTGSAVQGEYRVVYVTEDGIAHVLTGNENSGWKGFTGPNQESTIKLELASELLGTTGAMVIEHRVPTKDANAELSIKVLNFEGQVDPTGITMSKTSGTYKPGDTFNLGAQVTPENVTNGAINYYLDEASANKGVTVDNNGNVTISEDAANGQYIIWAESVANPNFKISYTLTVDSGSQTKDWNNKQQILEGVGGEKWVYNNNLHDDGVGEGADLRVEGSEGWTSIGLENRPIKTGSFILTYGARTFVRSNPIGQETFPEFAVKVTNADNETKIIRAIGSDQDYLLVNKDEVVHPRYDLSEYIGQTVKVEIGIRVGGHGVITEIHFEGNDSLNTSWMNKTDILADNWKVTGNQDAGVSDGVDIKDTGSYLSKSFMIGAYNDEVTVGFRAFHRDGETYPDIKFVVVDGESETIIRANGVDSDTVHVDTDEIQHFTYNIASFIGKRVELRIQLVNNATHCVITDIQFA